MQEKPSGSIEDVPSGRVFYHHHNRKTIDGEYNIKTKMGSKKNGKINTLNT
jgi:hypothetical protein